MEVGAQTLVSKPDFSVVSLFLFPPNRIRVHLQADQDPHRLTSAFAKQSEPIGEKEGVHVKPLQVRIFFSWE